MKRSKLKKCTRLVVALKEEQMHYITSIPTTRTNPIMVHDINIYMVRLYVTTRVLLHHIHICLQPTTQSYYTCIFPLYIPCTLHPAPCS